MWPPGEAWNMGINNGKLLCVFLDGEPHSVVLFPACFLNYGSLQTRKDRHGKTVVVA